MSRGSRRAIEGTTSARYALGAALVVAAIASSVPVSAAANRAPESVVPPKLVWEERAVAPGHLRSRGAIGWVTAHFVVEADGSVSDVTVERTSGIDELAALAVETLHGWRYEPARRNGRPEAYGLGGVDVVFRPAAASVSGINVDFRNKLREVHRAIEHGRLQRARDKLDRFARDGRHSLVEEARYWLMEHLYAAAAGDAGVAITALQRAVARGGADLTPGQYAAGLEVLFLYHASLNEFGEALFCLRRLQELREGRRQVEALQPIAKQIRDVLESDAAVGVEGRLNRFGAWHYRTARRVVQLDRISGELTSVRLACTGGLIREKPAEGLRIDVPQDYGDCSLVVSGTPDATFRLIEAPPTPARN